jgi:restriction endonuclease
MKRGENLQQLVYTLERAINSDPAVQMASPKRFRDKKTNKPREHDVAITFNLQHHKFILVIECRDRTRPVGVPDVEAFKKKCERTGVDKGVIVSSTGFADSALTVAVAEDIGCMSLEDAERFDWCQVPAIEQMTRRFVEGPVLHIDFPRPFEGEAKLLRW